MGKCQELECPGCGKLVQVTHYGKIAPHKRGNVRCGGSGSRVTNQEAEKNKNAEQSTESCSI